MRAMVERHVRDTQRSMHRNSIPDFHRVLYSAKRIEARMSYSPEGKVVVVSGASMGVGRATAERFARDGATVVLLARRKLLLDEVAETIGANAVPIVTDVTCSTDVCAAFEQVAAQFGRVDILVNSAGGVRNRLVQEGMDAGSALSLPPQL